MRVIIIGAGKVGYSLAERLSKEGHSVVVIEKDEERRSIIQTNLDVMTIGGNGSSPKVLAEAGVSRSGIVIAVTDSDEVNMIACLVAKQSGVGRTIARVRNEDYTRDELLLINTALGVDLAINPEMITALEINTILKTPGALNIEHFADGKVQMFETKISEKSVYANIPLLKLKLPQKILVAGIMRLGRMIIPSGKDLLLPNDHVFFVGENEAITAFEEQFSNKKTKVERVLIIGAGRIGKYMAGMLKESGMSVKIIEKNREKAQKASDFLEGPMIFCADGADIEFLKEIGANEADAVVCLTEDDKLNLILALMTKHLGAERTIIRLERSEFIPLIERIGVDVVVSPRTLTAGAILRLVRPDNIAQISVLQGAAAEVMEIIVPPKFHYIDKYLKDAKFPKNALIGTIVRGEEVIIPGGYTSLMLNDRVIVIALPEAVNKVVEYFER